MQKQVSHCYEFPYEALRPVLPRLWVLHCLGEQLLMNKVRGRCVPLPLHYAKANWLRSRNSNNGSDPLVHPHSQSLPKVPASILTSLVLCLILLRTLDSVVLILITFANKRSNSSLADTGLRQRSFHTFFDSLESQSSLTLRCLLQLPPLVYTFGKEIGMKIYGLSAVTVVDVI